LPDQTLLNFSWEGELPKLGETVVVNKEFSFQTTPFVEKPGVYFIWLEVYSIDQNVDVQKVIGKNGDNFKNLGFATGDIWWRNMGEHSHYYLVQKVKVTVN